jgi:hypothetical protein
MKKEPEILEGEIVSDVSANSTNSQKNKTRFNFNFRAPPNFSAFQHSTNNCNNCCGLTVLLLVLALILKNWLLVPLAFLLPVWLFFRKRP